MLSTLIRKILRRKLSATTFGARYRVCDVTKGRPGFQTVDQPFVSRF